MKYAPGEPPTLHTAVIHDISARKEAEQLTRHARAELESTLAALPDLLFEADDQGRIYDYRAPSPERLAVAPEHFLGRTIHEVLPPGPAVVIQHAICQAIEDGRTTSHRYELEIQGQPCWFELSLARKHVESGRPRVIGIARDVTETVRAEARQRSLEAQLRQSQKMEAVGTLAGGIAHDFNNLLAVIALSVVHAQRSLPDGHPVAEELSAIDAATRRATKLVEQILAFSRTHKPARELVSANEAVLETARLLRATLPAGIELNVVLASGSPNVLADPTQLQQVLVNLGTNAWQAIERGHGTITLRVQHVTIEGGSGSSQADLVKFSVTDTGVGIPGEIRDRIFEPFFTTKLPGAGTGLGLSVVHGIIAEHGGRITVHSEPGVGTTFEIELGIEADAGAEIAFEVEAGKASIIYVDDEPLILRPFVRLLRMIGYRALGFSDPRVALDAIRADPRAVDLVITDLNMPGMSGLDLAAQLTAIRDDLPILLVSGHAPVPDEQLRAAGIRHRLAKPIDVAALTELLASLLRPTIGS